MKINIFSEAKVPCSARGLRLIKRVCEAALRRRAGGELNIIFTGGAGIRRVNRRFLRRDAVTDVIAFNYAACPAKTPEPAPFGDIFICVPQAKRQAAAFGHSPAHELLVLAAHGALHLAGLDDASPASRKAMLAAGDKIIATVKKGKNKK